MMTISTVGINKFKKDINKLGTGLTQVTTRIVAKKVNNFSLQFDEVDIIPYSHETSGEIIIGSFNEENSTRTLEAILGIEVEKLVEEATNDLQQAVRGLLDG